MHSRNGVNQLHHPVTPALIFCQHAADNFLRAGQRFNPRNLRKSSRTTCRVCDQQFQFFSQRPRCNHVA